MDRQNVTLSLPRALLKKAKLIAARKEKSLSALIREALEKSVSEETGYRKAKQRHTRLLKKGFDLGTGGQFTIKRDELHDRR